MISLDKKYKTAAGWDVVLFEISDKVYGKVNYDNRAWQAYEWPLDGTFNPNSLYNLVEAPSFVATELNETYRSIVTVNYFGVPLSFQGRGINYLTTDKSGFVQGHASKPEIEDGNSFWGSCKSEKGVVGLFGIKYEGDWKQSLMRLW